MVASSESNEKIHFFLFEKLAHKVCLWHYLLYPVPYLVIFLLVSVIPNYYLFFVGYQGPLIKSSESFLTYNIYWFILTTYALYVAVIYKRKFSCTLASLRTNEILKNEDYKIAKNTLFNWKWFFFFLTIFEISFFIWWQPSDLPGFFIVSTVLPIGAEIFAAFTACAVFPWSLKGRIEIQVFNFDKHGGLKPISELLMVFVFVYFVGITLSYILYSPFISHPIFGSIFISIGVIIFAVPQIALHFLLATKKNFCLEDVQKKITEIHRKVQEINPLETVNKISEYNDNYSALKTVREDIESMRTWPFDLNVMFKFVASIVIPLIPTLAAAYNVKTPEITRLFTEILERLLTNFG